MKVQEIFENKLSVNELIKNIELNHPELFLDIEEVVPGFIHVLSKNDKELFYGSIEEFESYVKKLDKKLDKKESLNYIDKIIIEDLQLSKLIDKEISIPLNRDIDQIKDRLIKQFIPKLKSWALSALPTASKLGKKHLYNVQKYLKYPERAASQLIDAILSKRLQNK